MEGGDDQGWPCHPEALATESILSGSCMKSVFVKSPSLPSTVSWRLVQGCCFGERAVRFEEPWPTSFKMALSWDWLARRDSSLELMGYTTPSRKSLIDCACFFQATAEGEVWFWESSSLLQAIGSKPCNHCSNHGSVLQPALSFQILDRLLQRKAELQNSFTNVHYFKILESSTLLTLSSFMTWRGGAM